MFAAWRIAESARHAPVRRAVWHMTALQRVIQAHRVYQSRSGYILAEQVAGFDCFPGEWIGVLPAVKLQGFHRLLGLQKGD